ncbi:MAG: Ig-like domain-containing protein, partial [Bacteroidales bacterium]|nr:Ig-like domain-containing protein [Bacteroidales bacterium]
MTACCLLVLGCCLTGCKDDDEKVLLTAITVNPTSLTMAVGEKRTITATPVPENASDVQFTWTSKDPAIATVNPATGEVEAKTVSAEGTDIEVRCGEVVATVHVTVEAMVVALQDIVIEGPGGALTDLTLAMRIGDEPVELMATPMPTNSTQTEFTWETDNNAVAGVLYLTGRITAKTVGTANITVTEAASGKFKTVAVTVGKKVPTAITPNKTSALLRVGDEESFTATPDPADADDEFIWTSNNTDILTVNSATGAAVAVAAGAATITVSSNIAPTVTAEIGVKVVSAKAIVLVAPADGADLFIYDGAPDYRFEWMKVASITAYTLKVATTEEGLATTPLAFDVGDADHRDVTQAECATILNALGINDGNSHTLYWTVVSTGTSVGEEVRSVKVKPNVLPKSMWPWIGASDCYYGDGLACNDPNYRPQNAIDGDLSTSWRCSWQDM